MKKIFLAILIISLLIFGGCSAKTVEGTGEFDTVSYDISTFDNISIANGFITNIKQGDKFSVDINTNKNVFEYIEVSSENGTLEVGLIDNHSLNNTKVTVDITCPNIAGVKGVNSSIIDVKDGFEYSNLKIDLSNSSVLNMGNITANNVEINLSNSSSLKSLSFIADDINANLSNSSTVNNQNMQANNLIIDTSNDSIFNASGSGERVFVSGKNSSIIYLKNYVCDIATLVLKNDSVCNINSTGDVKLTSTNDAVLNIHSGNLVKVDVSSETTVNVIE